MQIFMLKNAQTHLDAFQGVILAEMINYPSKTLERGRGQITAKLGVFHGFLTGYDERVLHRWRWLLGRR